MNLKQKTTLAGGFKSRPSCKPVRTTERARLYSVSIHPRFGNRGTEHQLELCAITHHRFSSMYRRINPDRSLNVSKLELIHDQLPLAVPCYNLLPVTEFTVGRNECGRRAFPAPLS